MYRLLQVLYLVFIRGYVSAVDVYVPVFRRRTREEGRGADGTVTPKGEEEGAVELIVDELTLGTDIMRVKLPQNNVEASVYKSCHELDRTS